MRKIVIAAIASGLLATSAFAQDEVRAQAENAIEAAGLSIEIPADATEDQLTEVIAILNQTDQNSTELEGQVKQILGME